MCYTKYKKVSGVETDFVWDGDEIGAEYDENGNVTNVLFRGNNLVRDGKGNNYVYDSHGSVTSILNNNGSKSKEYEYDAFGNIENETNASTYNPWQYCGEYTDQESGFIYLRNRYYDSEIGRFINEDPARSGGNWYSYCSGNPIMFWDPSGLERGLAVNFAYDITPLFGVNKAKWDNSKKNIATLSLGWGSDKVVRDYNYNSGMAYIPKEGVYRNIVSVNNENHIEMERTDFYDSLNINYVKFSAEFSVTKAGEIVQKGIYVVIGTAVGLDLSDKISSVALGVMLDLAVGEFEGGLVLEEGEYVSEVILCDRPIGNKNMYENVETVRVLQYKTNIETGEKVPVRVVSDYKTKYVGLTQGSEVNKIKNANKMS
ncbi:MAG: RHS repeat domain-containing protein [Lachnospirales bacterium]